MPGIDPFDEESDDQIVQNRHLKKKKRGKSDSAGEKMPATKKRKKQSTAAEENEPTMEEKEQMLQEGIDEARMQFENDRDELLASLPSSYSEKFKEIGFVKWGKTVIPVLVLSPYDVPPGKVRNDWMRGYENCKKQGRVENMSYLVYWYGCANDLANCYSFVVQKKITFWDAAVKKNIHKPKAVIQNKKKLSVTDKAQMEQYQEMEEDLEKAKEDRVRGAIDFTEGYEMLTLEDLEDISPPQNDAESVHSLSSNDAKKKRKVDKKASAAEQDDGKVPKQKKKKQRASTTRKNSDKTASQGLTIDSIGDAEESEDEEMTEKSSAVATVSKGKRKIDRHRRKKVASIGAGRGQKKQEIPESEEDMGPSTPEASSDDDSDYGAEARKQRVQADDPEETIEAVESMGDVDAPKKQKKKSMGNQNLHKKKDAKEVTDKTKKDRERRAFRDCEKQYCTLLDQWKLLIDHGDHEGLKITLRDVSEHLHAFSATFIEQYGISILMKRTKKVLRDNGSDLSTYKNLLSAFRSSYEEKKKEIPIDYNPKHSKRKEPTAGEVEVDPSSSTPNEVIAVPTVTPGESSKVPLDVEKKLKLTVAKPEREAAVIRVSVPGREGKDSPSRRKQEPPAASSRSQPTAKPKPRKSFNLNAMLRGPKDSASDKPAQQAPVKSVASKSLQLPTWMTDSVDTGNLDEQRSLALDFLLDMAAHFPQEKINKNAIARSIENSIFKACKKTDDTYWKTIHKVVAAVCGKSEVGSLFHMILAGKFERAEVLVKLKNEDYVDSFEGRAVLL